MKYGQSYLDVTSEWAIRTLISQCLSKGETLEHHEHFDLYALEGIKNLSWPPKTAVEIKPNMIYDTMERVRSLYTMYGMDLGLLVIITDVKPSSYFRWESSGIYSRNIKIITVTELLNKATPFLQDITEKLEDDKRKAKEAEDSLLEKARYAIKNDKVSLFLGAGVSASAGVVTWDRLLEQLCIKKNIAKLDSDFDDIVKGRHIVEQYMVDTEDGKEKILSDEFYEDIRDILYTNSKSSSDLIKSISKLALKAQLESVISYNYDDLVERGISSRRCHAVYDKSRPTKGKDVQIYHVHGFIPHEGSWSPIVLGEKEYHKIYQEAFNWGNVEQLHALSRSTCFFIGLSMRDPNLRRLLDISLDGGEKKAVHYAFLRRIEYNVPFTEATLSSLGVNCIWYEQHKDLPDLINRIVK